ncbi:MAG: hypothetical protein OXI24_17410 [Candidatus Poribacteria bacterium]|nr:hypothetical protein [Candidatus Poribacteria bacterium]
MDLQEISEVAQEIHLNSISSKTDIKVFTGTDTLTGADVVPGFSCRAAQLFE